MSSSVQADSSPSILVLGAGISGLACALRLAESGRKVTLLEASDQLGGLGTFFQHDGRTFEKFYHCMLPSDGPLLALLDSLDLTQDIYWKPSSFAYARGGRIHPLNTPVDLLRFSPLPFVDRIRVGITGAWGRVCSDKGLDDMTTAQWLQGLSGRRAFTTFWQPMLEAKFGDRYHDVPALWFWTRFNREKGESKGEVKGYIRGGYKRITDTFARRLQDLGVTLRLNERTEALDVDAEGGAIVRTTAGELRPEHLVITLPWPSLSGLASEAFRQQAAVPDWDIDFQGVINQVLFLRRPLTKHYWLATPEPDYPFDGVVETSTLTDEADRGQGRHVVYLTKYVHRTDPRFSQPDAEVETAWFAALQRLFPDLKASDLETSYVFRAPFVEPVYTRGFLKKRPPEIL
ncbi:MAG TPA: FAD-dependent oxidoreductase, partial [Prosthecobacter sp.]